MEYLASFLAVLVTIATGWLVIKRYPTVIVLLGSGLIMIAIAILFGADHILPKGAKSTGLVWFDLVDLIRLASVKQVAGIGMIIMVAGGFAKYMERIGASGALVKVCISPLKALKSPYLVLALCYMLGAAMCPVVPSHGGLAMLLLTTMYPILLKLGVSRAGAAAAIFCSGTIGMGPGTGTALFAAKIADIEPIVYFVQYQLPVAIPMIITIAVLNFFVQRYYDRKNDDVYTDSVFDSGKLMPVGPSGYAILPVLPIALLCVFSKFGYQSIQLNTVTALFLAWIIGVVVELIRRRDLMKVCEDAMAMIKGMGSLFTTIVSLIIAAQIFATGIKLCGLIDLLLKCANYGGFGMTGMAGVLSGLIAIVAFLTGSGVGALTSLGSIATDVAAGLGGDVTQLISSMQFTAGLARGISPVAGATIVVAAAAGITPIAIIRRTAIPMLGGWIVMMIGNYLLLG
ncbi:C4-dicarboxylate transporter DcuC [Mesosutterella sp. OilRF-GAM-744-9]|uniref:C4-dicarboxylate transporter DcuC n=1 Tax=Mesosutterella porci TaxID=2915351 RepID=A0ABS9MQ10_9BURK|nr:C4-dicarboxylate transporter DcuC [Mesosutterella sp. oilRF-744-WT-GAM-9]MCG5030702.1 C4-dicarboxylate transporter DcuC [Mesosutterella sp. oilRF-744-WT-GAM-9]MCI6530318.1 C4-dicarboxylate transporter DcuC [Mesosutterella sp.]